MKMSDELVYYIFGVYVQYTIKRLIDSAYSVYIILFMRFQQMVVMHGMHI